MNEDLQSYIEPELEARVVALVLGEASAFEAGEMERLMEERPELRRYKEGVEKVHGLVGEAHRNDDHDEWKLSEERRSTVFTKIEERKKAREEELAKQREKRISRQGLVYLCAACVVLMLILFVFTQLGSNQEKEQMFFSTSGGSEKTLAHLDEYSVSRAKFDSEMVKGDNAAGYFDGAVAEPAEPAPEEKPGDRNSVLRREAKLLKQEVGQLDKLMVNREDATIEASNREYDRSTVNLKAGKVIEDIKSLRSTVQSEPAPEPPATPAPVLVRPTAATALAEIDAEISSDAKSKEFTLAGGGASDRTNSAEYFGYNDASGKGEGTESRYSTGGRRGLGILPGEESKKARALKTDTTWMAKIPKTNQARTFKSPTGEVENVPTLGDLPVTGALFGNGDNLADADGDGLRTKQGLSMGQAFGEPEASDYRRGQFADNAKSPGGSANEIGEQLARKQGRPGGEERKSGQMHWGLAEDGVNPELPSEMPKRVKEIDSLANFAEDELDGEKDKSSLLSIPSQSATRASRSDQKNKSLAKADRKHTTSEDDADILAGGITGGDGKDWNRGRMPSKPAAKPAPESVSSGLATLEKESENASEKGGEKNGRDEPAKGRRTRTAATVDPFFTDLEVDPESPPGGPVEGVVTDDDMTFSDGMLSEVQESIAGKLEKKGKAHQSSLRKERLASYALMDLAEEELQEEQRPGSDRGGDRYAKSGNTFFRSAIEDVRSEMTREVDEKWELEVRPEDSGGGGFAGRRDTMNDPDPFDTGAGAGRRDNWDEPDPFDSGDEDESDMEGGDPFDSGEIAAAKEEVSFDFGDVDSIPLYANGKFNGGGNGQADGTVTKLNSIILPEFKIENTTVEDALALIQEKTRKLDVTSLDPIDAGVTFAVQTPKTVPIEGAELEDGFGAAVDLGKTKIKNLNLKNVPARVALQYLADKAYLRYKVEENGQVTLLPITSEEDEDVTQRRWDVTPDFFNFIQTGSRSSKRDSLVTLLKKNGVSFPPNSGAGYLADRNTLVVRNTPTNLELIDSIIEAHARETEAKKKELEKRQLERENFETATAKKSDSTFSLNVSDVSFKLAKAALAGGKWPDASKIRPEEFVNALDYDDTKPSQSEKIACAIEQGAHPFMQQRNLMRIAMSTASLGRNASTPLRLTILLDQSGSMERSDRAESVKRAFALLADQLNANDEITLVGFARTSRLLAERVKGNEAGKLVEIVANPLTEGGTNLEAALSTGLQLAKQQFVEGAQNRIILLTDGAANLGDALPENLAKQVESMRKHQISFDACGVGADGFNDDVLSSLTKQGDGRYYFLDRPEDADDGFARRIAGALRPAAKNVKVQILFNPERVSKFKLYGFEKHKLKKEDFRNDSVDAAEMAAEESGVALYHFEPIPEGRGDVGTVSVRFLNTASNEMVERTWAIPYLPEAPLFSDSKPTLRLAGVAGLFAERLKGSPVGERVDLKRLRQETELLKSGFEQQPRFRDFKTMLQQAGD